ncbi:MAG TPA: hypothetical protein VGB77_00255 [Abditibacteriaceae bacterium]|jgi:hypothetical protein
MPKKNTNPAPVEDASHDAPLPDDSAMLDELLEDMDTFGAMLDRAGKAVKQGKPDVRLIPRGKAQLVGDAIDQLGVAMTRRTLQVRAQRALRDGVIDETLSDVLNELAPDGD